ncbi:hypothetical protein GJ744_010209 [Endocarpon pusillum]|uniref:C2H2-type domain-containing protein n=1 Tax=Endocarpon pusillum TaxID=364733 RepID=A0A8H7E5L8_9EURO|nr:hypothetical protein GJ744_010209 [Endocarpon pusillum]
MASVTGISAETLISNAHTNCFLAFERLIGAVEKPLQRFENQISLAQVIDEFDKYRVWAGNVGAHHRGKQYEISLDYRLREASSFKAQVVRLLTSLEHILQRATTLLEGKQTPFEALTTQNDELQDVAEDALGGKPSDCIEEDSPWEVSDSSDDRSEGLGCSDRTRGQYNTTATSSIQPTTVPLQAARKPTMEMLQLMDTLKFIVTCLYKLPNRKPAPIDRIKERGFADTSLYQHFDVLYVRDKFPKAEHDLTTRLGNMISKRRQTFNYRSQHNEAFKVEFLESKDTVPAVKNSHVAPGPNAPSIRSSERPLKLAASSKRALQTKASTFQGAVPDALNVNELLAPSVAESKSSIASSFAGKLQLDVPPRPRDALGKPLEYFECPYCLVVCNISSTSHWKKHVLQDIQPYVCTFQGCELYDFVFENRNEWYKHETQRHRVEYYCNDKSHQQYSAKSDFIKHMEDDHLTTLNSCRKDILLKMFERPMRGALGYCQLCQRPSKLLKSHLSRHLEQIALFSLPRLAHDPDLDSKCNAWGSCKQDTLQSFSEESESDQSPVTENAVAGEYEVPFDEHVEQLEVPFTEDIDWDLVTDKFSQARDGTSGETPPHTLFTVPFTRDMDFVDGASLLHQINAKCSAPGSRVALFGLGGIGKSQLAIEWSYRIMERSPESSVFWVPANTASRFEDGYREIAIRAKIPGRNDPDANILQLVFHWLCNETAGKWFMVVDGADDIGIFFDTHKERQEAPLSALDGRRILPLAEYLPHTQNGSILITTRNKTAASMLVGPLGDIITVEPMSVEHALILLQKKLGNQFDQESAAELAAALDYMPLATNQAAAYIRENRWSVRKYITALHMSDESKAHLLNRDARDSRRDPSASNSIIMTWQLSFNHIRRTAPSAADLLSLMSFFDRQGIPKYLLQHNHETEGNGGRDNNDKDEGNSEKSAWIMKKKFADDVAVLIDYSLISINIGIGAFEMSRLVQLSTRTWLQGYGQLERWKERFIATIYRAFPPGYYKNWVICQSLFAHVEAAETQRPQAEESLKEWAVILHNAGSYARAKGNYITAERLLRKAIEAKEEVLGMEEPSALVSVDMLGLVLHDQGKYLETEELAMRLVEIQKRVLGPEHPDTLTSMNKLALTYRDQGRLKEAEELAMQVIEIQKRVLGPKHPDTLTSMNKLVLTYRDHGRLKEAEELAMQVIEIRKRVLGPEHPHTLSSMNSLAWTYQDQGRLKEAEELAMQVMEIRKRVLGPEHPGTLISMNNLAWIWRSQGRAREAVELMAECVQLQKHMMGEGHPDTVSSAETLHEWQRD